MGRTKLAPKPDWHNKNYFYLGMPVMKKGMTLPFTDALPDFLEHIKNDPVICINGHTLGMFFDVYDYEDYNGKLHYVYNPKRGLVLKTKKAELTEALKLRLFDVTKITVIMTNERAKEAWDLFIANTLISLRDTFVPIKSDKKSDTYYETTYQFTGINGKSYIALDTHEDTPTKLDDVKRDLDNFEVLSKIRGGLKTYKALDYANVIFHVINDAIVFKDCPDEFKDDKFKLYFGKDNDGKDIYVSQTNDFIWNTKYTKDEIAFLKYKRGKVHSNVSLWDNALEAMNTRYISILNDELCVDLRNWFIKNQINIKCMKFNMIIMNPPYDVNLHLKILEQAVQLLTEDGVCINLSPIRWLQDPLAEYKNGSDWKIFKDSIIAKTCGILVVKATNAQEYFGSGQYEDLGIYVIGKCKVTNDLITDINSLRNPKMRGLFDKVNLPTYKGEYKSIYDVRTKEGEANFEKPFVRVSPLHGNVGAKDWVDIISPQKNIVMSNNVKVKGSAMPTVNFDIQLEAENFFMSLQTTFMKACNLNCKVNMRWPGYAIPFMSDYSKPWTNERLCKFFKITGFISDTEAEPNSDWDEVLKAMKPYL